MNPYFPQQVFRRIKSNGTLPRVFISPQRYIQGPDVLSETGTYLGLLDARRVAVLISARGRDADGVILMASLEKAGIEAETGIFGGECSLEEIERQVDRFRPNQVDCLLAVGGGKCVDAGKAIAWRLGLPVVVIPTLASNDAPCSALSVIYSPEGVSSGGEFYPASPAIVVVDTRIVADASERYLVAGMGDAMATWYEAHACLRNPNAQTTIGARPTLASAAIGERCAVTLFEQGEAAAKSVARGEVSDALEAVVEANTLLSGLGFESGGVAAAHALAQSYTGVDVVRENYLHGEMVAMGTITQLMMESRQQEAVKTAEFFARIGLPINLAQVSLSPGDRAAIDTLVAGALEFPFMANMPLKVDGALVRQAVLDADALGTEVAGRLGDDPWRRLRD